MKRFNKIILELPLDDVKNLVKNHITVNEKVTIVNSYVKDNILYVEGVGGNHSSEAIVPNIDLPITFLLKSENVSEAKVKQKLPDEIKQQIAELFRLQNDVDLTNIYKSNPNYRKQIGPFVTHSEFVKDFTLVEKYKYKRK